MAVIPRDALSIDGAICNPSNPAHFMVIRPVGKRVRIYRGEALVADTTRALRLLEVGKTLYDPAIYVPVDALCQAMDRIDKSTLCPLKGEASYFVFGGEELAWSYDHPIGVAEQLANHLSFWTLKVRIEEGG